MTGEIEGDEEGRQHSYLKELKIKIQNISPKTKVEHEIVLENRLKGE